MLAVKTQADADDIPPRLKLRAGCGRAWSAMSNRLSIATTKARHLPKCCDSHVCRCVLQLGEGRCRAAQRTWKVLAGDYVHFMLKSQYAGPVECMVRCRLRTVATFANQSAMEKCSDLH